MNESFGFFRRVNLRHLVERRLRSLLTTAGVAAGVALVFSISVINGALVDTVRSSMRIVAGEAELEVAATDLTGLPERFVDRVAAADGVERAVPVTRVVSRTGGESGHSKTLWLGVTAEFPTLFPSDAGSPAGITVDQGRALLAGGALVTQQLADEIGARRGDAVEVQTPNGARSISVAGVLSGSALQAVNGGDFAVMTLPAAQELFDKGGRVDSIYVVTEPAAPLEDVKSALERELEGAGTVAPPGERAAVFERSFGTLQLLTSMAGVVALFVALFVVFNTMSMSVAERRRDISLALSLGMTRKRIFASFLIEAGVIGAVASVIGIAAGFALAATLVTDAVDGYRFMLPETTSAPLHLSASTVSFTLIAGILVSVLGSWVPVRRVLSVAPIEFLKPRTPFYSATSRGRSRAARIALLVAGGLTVSGIVAYSRTAASWLAGATLITLMTSVTLALIWVVPVAIRIVRKVLQTLFGPAGRLAGDALARDAGRTTATTAALLLSLAMVVGVGSAVESYDAQIARSARGWFGAPLYVRASSFTGFGSDQPMTVALVDELEKIEGVDHAYPGRYGFVNLEGDQAVIYAISVAEAAEDGATRSLSSAGIEQEEFIETLGSGGILVSRFTADALGIEAGERLSLPTPSGERSFDVGGLFDDLLPFYSVYMEHRTYEDAWADHKADAFALIPEEGASLAALERSVTEFLEEKDVPAEVMSRDQVIGGIGEITEGLVSIARGIQLAALIVAALTIANTMFMTVVERRWEFALSQAVGMTRRQLGKTVFLEAAGIGLIGSVGGVLFGTLFGSVMLVMMEQQFAWRVPFEPQWLLIGGAVVGGILLAASSALYPGRVAVRRPIVESLRYE